MGVGPCGIGRGGVWYRTVWQRLSGTARHGVFDVWHAFCHLDITRSPPGWSKSRTRAARVWEFPARQGTLMISCDLMLLHPCTLGLLAHRILRLSHLCTSTSAFTYINEKLCVHIHHDVQVSVYLFANTLTLSHV